MDKEFNPEEYVANKCLQLICDVIKTASKNFEKFDVYSCVVNIGMHFIIQMIAYRHVQDGIQAEKQFPEIFTFIKDKSRALIVEKMKEKKEKD